MAASMPLATSPLTALRASGRLSVITATRPCVSYWTMSVMRPMVGATVDGIRTDERLVSRGVRRLRHGRLNRLFGDGGLFGDAGLFGDGRLLGDGRLFGDVRLSR